MKFLLLVSVTLSATLTFLMKAQDRSCFYTESQTIGEKVGFYFAVREGGNFDVDYEVLDPNSKVVMSGMSQKEGDFVFVAQVIGEYSFCFSNVMSSFVDKSIDFDISIEHELKSTHVKSELQKAVGKTKPGKEDTTSAQLQYIQTIMGEGIEKVIQKLERQQNLMRTKEFRHFSVIRNTESRIVWFAVIESIALIGMGVLQVYAIQTFFAKSVRTRV